jgi:hypothetical protein
VVRYLLDEHISPAVAAGLRRRASRLHILALADWQRGEFMGQNDAAILAAAHENRLTLVTYDRRTIPPLLKSWAEERRHHGGVIFVDEKTISPADFGGLVRALLELAEISRRWNWTDRVVFLRR